MNQEWNKKTLDYIKNVKDAGFNLWPMIGLFKKRSKLSEPIPDEVIQAVCLEYMKRVDSIERSFPYFLAVLKAKSRDYFAKENIRKHDEMKKEPVKLKITIG